MSSRIVWTNDQRPYRTELDDDGGDELMDDITTLQRQCRYLHILCEAEGAKPYLLRRIDRLEAGLSHLEWLLLRKEDA